MNLRKTSEHKAVEQKWKKVDIVEVHSQSSGGKSDNMEDIIEEEPTVQDDVPEDLVRKSRSYHFFNSVIQRRKYISIFSLSGLSSKYP